MQKRIVVLGGVGFIGSHLCLRLLNDGHEVFCVDIRDAASSPLLRDMPPHPEFRYVRHNIVKSRSGHSKVVCNTSGTVRPSLKK